MPLGWEGSRIVPCPMCPEEETGSPEALSFLRLSFTVAVSVVHSFVVLSFSPYYITEHINKLLASRTYTVLQVVER